AFASITGKPGIVIGIHGCAKGSTLHSTSGEAGGDWRDRLAVGRELGSISLPECVLTLPADCEVVANPEIAFAVEHRFAASEVAAAGEFQGNHPCARRNPEVGHIRNLAHRLAAGNRVELLKKIKKSFWLVPRILRNRLSSGQRVCWRVSPRATCGRKQATARTRFDSRDTTSKRIGQGCKVRHRRRLAAVERVLNGGTPSARSEINETWHIPSRDLQTKRMTLQRVAVEKLIVRPDRRNSCEFVDRHCG